MASVGSRAKFKFLSSFFFRHLSTTHDIYYVDCALLQFGDGFHVVMGFMFVQSVVYISPTSSVDTM